MKKLVYLILLFVNTVAFSQSNTITYQAVIYLPSGQNTPGVDVANQPMTNKNICLQFSFIDENNRVEYQEEIKVKTDEFGMVNLTIGNGAQSGGYASSFDAIIWNASVQKKLQVALDAKGLCNQFELLSNEPIASVPFANAAITAGNVSGVVALANGGTGATSAAGVRANLGLSNVENTSDLNKPMSTATKTYVDSRLTSSTIVDADATTKGKIQLTGDLAGTAASPSVPGLALKENAANKSATTTLGTSDVLFPTQKAVKTYVDTAIAGATIVDAAVNTKGKIQLAGDLAGTAAAPTVPGLALKENAANKSTTTTLGTSDVFFPTQNAVKTYVDTAISGATIVDADANTKGKIRLTGDLAGVANSPEVAAGAISTTKLADNAVTTAKLVNASVTNAKLDKANIPLSGFAAAVAEVNLGSNRLTNVTNPTSPQDAAAKNYVDSSVSSGAPDADLTTKGKIQLTGDLTGSAGFPVIASNAVTSDKILDGTIVNADLSTTAAIAYSKLNLASSIAVGDLANNAVETNKIKDAAVTSDKILDGTIANADLSTTAAIAYSKLNLASSIVVGDLADNAVTTAKLANASVTNGKLDKTNIPLSGFGAAVAEVNLGSNKLINVTNPTAAQDAATKNYVDTATSGITTLADGKIYLGNASNEATEVTPTGDVTITNLGVTVIGTVYVFKLKWTFPKRVFS